MRPAVDERLIKPPGLREVDCVCKVEAGAAYALTAFAKVERALEAFR